MKRFAPLFLVPLVLAGCHKTAPREAGAGNASGEILPGSASDAMLPLDTARSQPPLAPGGEGAEAADAGAKKAKKHHAAREDGAAPDAPTIAPAAPTQAEPAPAPAPEPAPQ